MDKKYIITFNCIDSAFNDITPKKHTVEACNPLYALQMVRKEIINSLNEDSVITTNNYERIAFSYDGENDCLIYTRFVIRQIGLSYGFVVEYVTNCADGQETLALVKRYNLISEDDADAEWSAEYCE